MCRQTVESQTCTSVPEEERLSCAHIREGEEGRTKAKEGVVEGAKNVFVEMGNMVAVGLASGNQCQRENRADGGTRYQNQNRSGLCGH